MDQVAALDAVALTRNLVDIDSTTGKEREAGLWLAQLLRDRGYIVELQPVTDARFNIYAHLGTPPRVALSTHFDCVPPFFPSREERGLVFGRGSCDAKGILAAQIAAAEQLRAMGETRIGLLFVVGEERGSDGARVANEHAPAGVKYLINGEPTDNRLGAATRGVLRVRLRAAGRAAHSAFPELGDSAIDKLLDALMVIRGLQLPEDPLLGRTHYTVGVIDGGVAPNVVSPHASAELLFRIVGDGTRRAESAWRRRRPGDDRAGTGYSRRADAHRARLRVRGVPVYDGRATPHPLGFAAARRPRLYSRRPHRRRAHRDRRAAAGRGSLRKPLPCVCLPRRRLPGCRSPRASRSGGRPTPAQLERTRR